MLPCTAWGALNGSHLNTEVPQRKPLTPRFSCRVTQSLDLRRVQPSVRPRVHVQMQVLCSFPVWVLDRRPIHTPAVLRHHYAVGIRMRAVKFPRTIRHPRQDRIQSSIQALVLAVCHHLRCEYGLCFWESVSDRRQHLPSSLVVSLKPRVLLLEVGPNLSRGGCALFGIQDVVKNHKAVLVVESCGRSSVVDPKALHKPLIFCRPR
mmetsp:Transcript_100245/g.180898  ORF Transcript_100245/g.180898 Transcript_100245/m.180898 type:complete len:206 (+) Transcript_100245:251-868(+)